MKKQKISVIGSEISLFKKEKEYYISLTDMARYKNAGEKTKSDIR